jgi:uncharacterized protein
MQPSMFNVRVPLDDRPGEHDVFLMNTFTDAQLIVSREVADVLDRVGTRDGHFSDAERDVIGTLVENGFVVESREADRQALEEFFHDVREDRSQLRVTVLTTLQCNFACDYCIQGDHGDYNKSAAKMSMETAARTGEWTERRLDEAKPSSLALTFFGGEPLLNLPVLFYLSERLAESCRVRGVKMAINIITNGLLLTSDVVDRLVPLGLNGVKVTLDGDRDTHNRMRPLRGGQGTFDKIVHNVRQVAGKCRISIGGNFDESSVDSYPALLDFLREQEFADKIAKVAFKPVIKPPQPAKPKGLIPLMAIGAEGKPLGGACMTSAGTGASSICDNCNFLDDKMTYLREETLSHGFPTVDGVHMGPCEIHKHHAHTIGPDGSLYACPGFAGEAKQSTGHIDGRQEALRSEAAKRFDVITAWKDCDDCAYIPVCAGGCSVAAHTELLDMNKPNCHKSSFEAGLVTLARQAAASAELALIG